MQLGSFHQGQQSVLREHQPVCTAFRRTAGRCRTLHRQAAQTVATPLRTAIIPVVGPSGRQATDKVHRKKRRRPDSWQGSLVTHAKRVDNDDDDFVDDDVPEGFVDDEEELKGRPVAADDDDEDATQLDSLDAAADAEDEDEEEVQPARRRSNPKLMLHEDDADEAEEAADDAEDPDLDDAEPAAELEDDLDLDSIISGADRASTTGQGAATTPEDDFDEDDEGDVDDEDEYEEEEEVEELPGPSYPEPPERDYALGDLLEMAGYGLTQRAASSVQISGLCSDPYKVQPGDLFITLWDAVPEEWINEAIENGAAAFLGPQIDDSPDPESSPLSVPVIQLPDPWEALGRLGAAFYNEPSQNMTVIGVTGSIGKTTTSWLIRGIFEEWGKLTGMAGTIENAIYADKLDPEGALWTPDEPDPTLDRDCSAAFHLAPYQGKYPAPHRAPDPLEMQKLLAGMADRGADVAVVECEADGLADGRLDEVDMDIVVFTNLTTEDMEESEQSLEETLEAQARLLRRLIDPTRQRAIINLDDPHADEMRSYAAQVPVVTYAMHNKNADVYQEKMRFSLWETEVIVRTPVGALQIITPLIARHNVYNILAAVAVGLAVTVDGEPIPLKTIVQGIEATEIIPGRCEVIDEDQPFGCVVDAADTPAALSRLMDGLQECRPKRLILVLGSPGGTDPAQRPFMGEIAHYKADMVIMTNDSPLGEAPNEIIADMVAGYPDHILKRNASMPYQPGFLQDPGRVEYDALEFLWHNCYEYRRYVIEDRWEAIRWAIGSAQTDDCVVIVGRGHKDYVDWVLGDEIARGWFDDRVEARNALAKVDKLWQISNFDRAELPWMDAGEREGRLFNEAEV